MTIGSAVRTAGPYTGTNAVATYPFAFKVFAAGDLQLVQTDLLLNVSTLTLGSGYSVALNADQNASPGGSITLAANLPTGYLLTITSNVSATQGSTIPNAGGFFPKVIEDALDRLTILFQQLVTASFLKFPEIGGSFTLPAASSRANNALTFDSAGNPVVVAPATGSATTLATDLTSFTIVGKGAGQVGYGPAVGYSANTVGAAIDTLNKALLFKSKAANLGRTSNAVVDDSDLVIAVAAGTYAFRLYLPVWGASGCGIKLSIVCSGTATGQFNYVATVNGATPALFSPTIALAGVASIPQIFEAGPGPGGVDVIVLEGEAVVTIAGNLKLQWGQSINNGAQTMTIGAGAWMRVEKVG